MLVTEYGPGGYDATKTNDNIVNEYDIEPTEDAPEVTVSVNAIDTFLETLEDPATNSIAEIKTALKDFLNGLKEG